MKFRTTSVAFDFENPKADKAESLRWLALEHLDPDIFKWPVDKHVCKKLIDGLNPSK
jgi:hypothetical protein